MSPTHAPQFPMKEALSFAADALARVADALPADERGAPFSPDVLTLPEVAALLRVSEESVRQYAVLGKLPGRLIAGEWRFATSAIMAWLSIPEPRGLSQRPDRHWVEERTKPASAKVTWSPESEKEAEEFLSELNRLRKADSVIEEDTSD